MIMQTNLMGETFTPADTEKPWKELGCTESCYTAKEDRCVCRCGGAFHGLGNVQRRHEHDGGQALELLNPNELPEHPDNQPPTLQWYEAVSPTECKTCGGTLGPIEHYPHSGGWRVWGFEKRQWLYKTCQKCGYQWALWKLGVPR